MAYEETSMEVWAVLFRLLSHPDRLRLFLLIARCAVPLCVCELVDTSGIAQYQVSKHLRLLRKGRLIESRRVGRWAYYSLSAGKRARKLATFLQRVIPPEALAPDLSRLERRLSLREGGRCVLGPSEESKHGPS